MSLQREEAIRAADLFIYENDEVFDHQRFEVLHRFALESNVLLTDRHVDIAGLVDLAQYVNENLCHPRLTPAEVRQAVCLATSTPMTPAEVRQLMPKAEPPQEKIVYVKAPSISEPTDSSKPPVKVELGAPHDIDAAALLKTSYLVKRWLDSAALAELFGQWNAGKTFMALDLGAHIAAGQPWFGNRVRQGGVLYIGYEGARSMTKRIEALKREHPEWGWDAMPFRWYGFRWPLVNPMSAKCKGREMLDETLGQFWFETGNHPALIIVDPLRDALGGSDSDPAYTAAYIALMRQIRDTIGATILTLHHPGHGDKTRGRGDSGIDAAMDTTIHLAKEKGADDRGQISTPKQRDDEKGRMYYRLKIVELGEDDEGDPVRTCVFEQAEAPQAPLTGDQAKAWEAIGDNMPGSTLTEVAAREACKAAGIRGNHVTRALKGIEDRKLIKWDHTLGIIKIGELFQSEDEGGEIGPT